MYPYLPSLVYAIAPRRVAGLPYATKLFTGGERRSVGARVDEQIARLPAAGTRIPTGNRLVIPKIGVDIAVVEGADDRALLRGAWRIPGTSTSPDISNMVLSAHRFRYRPPSSATFYLLDKLKPDDLLLLYWEGKEYDYRVRETKVVDPSAVEILDASSSPLLTLFTCTPLFSTSQRLVVIAEPL